ncbi:MAG: hypothetical protein HeimC3_04800 [Candidatus Heimdallarchaeota archaeon LC_3]|nr:MAG: hypothetical protein HeimC3_04800 [Candidatus Heimdallarchaeota archaeon LC_3]
MSISRISTWFKDPITLLGFMNLFTMMQLTLYRTYLAIFLEFDIFVSILIISLILSSINFFQIFMRVPLAGFSQVIGRKSMILFGNLFIALAMISLVFTVHPVMAFFSSILVGIGMSAHWPATFAYIQDVSPNNYGKSNGRIFKIGDVGIIIGSLSAKFLIDQVNIGLKNFFLILFIVGIISVLIFYLILPEVINPEEKIKVKGYLYFIKSSIGGMFVSIKNISRHPGMLIIFVFQFFVAFTEFIFSSLFASLVKFKGFSDGTPAEIVFWATLCLLWLKPYLGNLSDRFGFRYPIIFSLFTIGLVFLIMINISDIFFLVIIYIIVTACLFIAYPAVNGATAQTASVSQRGMALGALGVYTSLGRSTSTIAVYPIWEFFDIEFVFLFSGFFIIGIGFVLWFWSRTSQLSKSQNAFN